jgi:hypothetical protein
VPTVTAKPAYTLLLLVQILRRPRCFKATQQAFGTSVAIFGDAPVVVASTHDDSSNGGWRLLGHQVLSCRIIVHVQSIQKTNIEVLTNLAKKGAVA